MMKLKEIVSCYLTKSYKCDRATYGEIVDLFEEKANTFEDDWRKHTKSDDKVVFKKGAAIALTFHYSRPIAEVQVFFEYDEQSEEMKLSVGNSGFPFEPLLSKKRYLVLLEKIHSFIVESGKIL